MLLGTRNLLASRTSQAGVLAKMLALCMGEGFGVPATLPARLPSNGCQAPQGLETDVMLHHTWPHILQMAVPRVAI